MERSIAADVDNLVVLLRMTRLLPPEIDLERLAPELKRELRREADYRREPELTRTELAALVVPGHGEIVQVGDHVEGIVLAWQAAKKEEGRDLPRLMLDAVYVDMDTKKVTTETR